MAARQAVLLAALLFAVSTAQQQQGVSPTTSQPAVAPSPTPFSYAQAARRGTGGGSSTGQQQSSVAPTPASGQPSGVHTTPRSYSNVAHRHSASSTPRPAGVHTPRPTHAPHRAGGAGYHGPATPRPTLSPAAANISDDDLRTFSEDLLRNDANNAATGVRTNWQGRTYGANAADLAPAPLLTIAPKTLQMPTISKLRALYDNYEIDSALAENVTPVERNEDAALLDAIVATQIMAKTRRFLLDKNMLQNNPGSLRALLHQLWFTMYPRLGGGSQIGSSAFEHVFLAELRRGEVSGLHNWVYFGDEEKKGKMDYLGYIRRIDLGGRGSVVKHHFKWGNVTKPVGSMFVGTSPELEMALYTVCYLARPDDRCPVRLGGEPFNIKTHSFTYRGAKYIGSAFPDV